MILREEENPEDSSAKPNPMPSNTAKMLSQAGEINPEDIIGPIIISWY